MQAHRPQVNTTRRMCLIIGSISFKKTALVPAQIAAPLPILQAAVMEPSPRPELPEWGCLGSEKSMVR